MRIGDKVRHVSEKSAVGTIIRMYPSGQIEVSGYGAYNQDSWVLLRELNHEEIVEAVLLNLEAFTREIEAIILQREREAKAEAMERKRQSEEREKDRSEGKESGEGTNWEEILEKFLEANDREGKGGKVESREKDEERESTIMTYPKKRDPSNLSGVGTSVAVGNPVGKFIRKDGFILDG